MDKTKGRRGSIEIYGIEYQEDKRRERREESLNRLELLWKENKPMDLADRINKIERYLRRIVLGIVTMLGLGFAGYILYLALSLI